MLKLMLYIFSGIFPLISHQFVFHIAIILLSNLGIRTLSTLPLILKQPEKKKKCDGAMECNSSTCHPTIRSSSQYRMQKHA